MQTLDELMLHMIQDIYYAEKQVLKALPRMSRKASSKELSAAFDAHRAETETQIERLEQAFEMLGKKPKAIVCAAMDGLIEEAKDIMKDAEDPEVLDAGMLAAAQAVEHYEIARYGTIIAWAKQLKRNDIAELLQLTLDEEKQADAMLSKLAVSRLNAEAM